MWRLDSDSINSEQSIIRLIVVFVLAAILLFLSLTLLLLIPNVDKVFDRLQDESEKATVKIYSAQLKQYVKDRELALYDIADNEFVVNTVLSNDDQSPAFKDYIGSVQLLGEDPLLSLLDFEGGLLFSELDSSPDYLWVAPLLNSNELKFDQRRLNIVNDNADSWFELAVPIFYGRGVEGVLVARFDASPSTIYEPGVEIGRDSAVSYVKSGVVVESDHSGIDLPSKQSLGITDYGIDFTHTYSRKYASLQKRSFLKDLIFSVVVGSFILFFFLFLLGRKIILKPYLELFKARESLVESENKINDSLQFQSIIFESIPDMAFVKDEDFRIIQANHAYSSVYPQSMRDSILGSISVNNYSPKEAEKILEYDKKAFKEGFSQVEETILFPDGVKRDIVAKKVRFQDASGRKFILIISRDISEFKATENELRQANVELEEFAYRTSHDLRSPLVSSIGMLNIIEKDIENGQMGRVDQCLAIIRKSLTGLENLVQDILNLTELKNVEEPKQLIDVEAVIDETLEKFSQMQGFDRIVFKKNLSFHEPLQVEPARFVMVFENLISNAIKYHDPEKAESYVCISSCKKGNDIVFSISDNGLGVPEAHRDKLFSMFKRFHPRTSFGSGLGLYMVKKSIEMLGGRIDYQALLDDDGGNGEKNNKNNLTETGSIFIVTLPLSLLAQK